jgi:hypothetical protein
VDDRPPPAPVVFRPSAPPAPPPPPPDDEEEEDAPPPPPPVVFKPPAPPPVADEDAPPPRLSIDVAAPPPRRRRHHDAPALFVIEVDSTPLGERVPHRAVLPSAAGPLRLPNIYFDAKPRKRAANALRLGHEMVEIPPRTAIADGPDIRRRQRLKVAVAIEDVSTFTKAATRKDLRVVEVIASLVLPEIDAFYADQPPFAAKTTRAVPRGREMTHPLSAWKRPARVDVEAVEGAADW